MRFLFGECELDTDRYELRRNGVVQRVEPQVFEVLVLLLRDRDRVVTKEQILDAVWGNRFVSESALTSRIKAARRVIGDDGRAQRLIRTVHGRGYQFVGSVQESEATRVPATTPRQFHPTATDLVERDEPLATLKAAYEAAASGHGQVALVSGEPGIGKTALVSRFAADLPDGHVLWGACDDLLTPRPLGPLRDIAGGVSAPLKSMIIDGTAPHEIHSLLIDELNRSPSPTVLVIDDAHWADDATLDAVTFIGRRIAALPAMLVLTFRTGEDAAAGPLHAALAAVRSSMPLYLELTPLSHQAVASLAGDRSNEVYSATGGNPFFVSELLTTVPDAVPPSVTHAVVGRAARLSDEARYLVDLVSVVPTRINTAVLDGVMPNWAMPAEEAERQHLLQVNAEHVQFRHELARNAILSNVPGARRRRLHAEVLDVLLKIGADPADIVHHAEAAGATEITADYALVAARRAAAVGSNREAYAHFVRAAKVADRLALPEQAALFEEFATIAYLVVRMDEAFSAIDRAITTYEGLADHAAVGRCIRFRSRLHWYAGHNADAQMDARAAIAILQPLGDSEELARAYSGLSQLAMLASDEATALSWGRRAVDLATKLGDDRTKAHALVNIGSVEIATDPDRTATLWQAHQLADTVGDRHEAVRALLNVSYTGLAWIRPDLAWGSISRAIAYADEYQIDTLLAYARCTSAWLQLREGDLEAAENIALAEFNSDTTVTQLLTTTILTELAVRRGDPAAAQRLADLSARADRTGELQRIVPVLELETEWAITTGAPMPERHFASTFAMCDTIARPVGGWAAASLAGWAAVAGIETNFGEPGSPVHGAMVRRDWAAAADAFGAAGWTYHRALMLSLLDDEPALAEALKIARRLGTRPLINRVVARLRERGLNPAPTRH